MRAITNKNIATIYESIKIENNAVRVAKEIIELMEIDKIEFVFKDQVTENDLNNGKQVVVNLFDNKYIDFPKFIQWSDLIISGYIFFLKKIKNDENLHIDGLLRNAREAAKEFKIVELKYDIKSRYGFIDKKILYTKIEDIYFPVSFDNLSMSNDQINFLKEIFKVRNEFFCQLCIETESFIEDLELSALKNNKIIITDHGKTLITELISGLELDNEYISNYDKAIQKMILDCFGVSSREHTQIKANLKNRSMRPVQLTKLVDKMEKVILKRSKSVVLKNKKS